MRKTKIVCTVGPAVDNEEKLEQLMRAGMDAARFNFSHGTHESQLATLNRVKKVRDNLGLPVATVLDTKGPEIRIRSFKDGKITLQQGDRFTLTTDEVVGDNTIVSVTFHHLLCFLKDLQMIRISSHQCFHHQTELSTSSPLPIFLPF